MPLIDKVCVLLLTVLTFQLLMIVSAEFKHSFIWVKKQCAGPLRLKNEAQCFTSNRLSFLCYNWYISFSSIILIHFYFFI